MSAQYLPVKQVWNLRSIPVSSHIFPTNIFFTTLRVKLHKSLASSTFLICSEWTYQDPANQLFICSDPSPPPDLQLPTSLKSAPRSAELLKTSSHASDTKGWTPRSFRFDGVREHGYDDDRGSSGILTSLELDLEELIAGLA